MLCAVAMCSANSAITFVTDAARFEPTPWNESVAVQDLGHVELLKLNSEDELHGEIGLGLKAGAGRHGC